MARAKDKFAVMLRHLRKIDADTTWEAFLSKYDQEPEYKAVSGGVVWPVEFYM